MILPAPSIPDQKKEFDVALIGELLKKIHAPPDSTGLSYAIAGLLDSARAISKLAPSSRRLSDLVFILENAAALDYPAHLAKRDLNPMFGRYEEYPLYSLFTQRKKMEEGSEFTARFYLVAGLLLVSVWLPDTPWDPIENGYAAFVNELRRTRVKGKWDRLRYVVLDAQSLGELVDRLPNQAGSSKFLPGIRDLASRINKMLAGSGLPQSAASKHVDKPLLEQNPEEPPNTEPERPDDVKPEPYQLDEMKPESVRPNRREPDYGDRDEWGVGKKKRARPVATHRPAAIKVRQLVLWGPATRLPGVDASESEVTASVAEATAAPNAGELPSLPLQKWQVLDARYATELDNQFLPFSWEVLNEYDLASIVNQIKSVLGNELESPRAKIGALAACLSIMASRCPEDLAGFRLFRSRTTDGLAFPAILVDHACWYSPFPLLERFKPDNEQARWLKPVGDGCCLPLPVEVMPALDRLTACGETLGEALGCSAEELADLVQDFCQGVRKDAQSRANVSWLRGVMFHKLLALSGDEVGSIATLGNAEHAPGVGLYYVTFEQAKWRNLYSRALTELTLTPSVVAGTDSLPYGSRQYPDEAKLRDWIAPFSQRAMMQCKGAKSVAEIIVAHNYYAGYSFLMLLACTGHRPANPYTFGIQSLDTENGWMIISDKITSPPTRFRLTPLPPLALKQLGNYLVHLRNLSWKLHSENPELADKIAMLVEAPAHPLIPLFFRLDADLSVSAIDATAIEKKYGWPFECNACRHFLATGLRKHGVLSEHIAVLLGHVGAGQFGFGKFSALSPQAWKEKILPALGLLLEEQGWASIAGITHLRWTGARESRRRFLPSPTALDCFAKARKHITETKSDREIVRQAFDAAKQNTPPERPREVFLEAFRNEIMARSLDAPDRLGERLNFHVRFIRLHRNALNPISIPGWAADMQGEDSPLAPEMLALANCAGRFRDAARSVFREKLDADLHMDVALVMISSILFGGLLRKNLVEQIPDRLNSGVRWFEGYLWMDFDDPKSGGVRRWFADPVTALLIARLCTRPEACQAAGGAILRKAIIGLLERMGQGLQENAGVNSLDGLIEISKAYFTLRLPGLLRAYAVGEVGSASLAEGCWLRLLSGRPLAGGQEEDPGERERDSIQPLRQTSRDVKSARAGIRAIFDAIRDAFSASGSGATNRKGARKNSLTKLIGSLERIATANPDMPQIVSAVLSWTNHLATEGSVVVRKPAIGTIYSYVTDIARPLVEFCSEVDFFELNEAELTDIYQRVIDYGSKNNRASRANSLRWFHEYCEEEFDITELDWGDVAPGLTSGKAKVSANLVTFPEYCAAKSLIAHHPQLDMRDRQMHLAALILLYRCGLRLGELLRLTVSDLVFQGNGIMLVRNGIYGKTKTRAGIRQVPWLGGLSEEEKSVIGQLIEQRRVIADGDPWCALFGVAEESRTLEVRLHLSRTLTETLRFVTGDPAIKIHHLRHGAGTSALALALSAGRAGKVAENVSNWFGCKEEQDVASGFRKFHLGQPEPTRRIVYAISQALGHTSPRTTCWHYGHLLDISLYEQVAKLAPLKNIEVAGLSGMSQNAIGVAVFKNPDSTPAELALGWLLKDARNLEPLTRLADQPATAVLPSKAPIQPLTSPKLAHNILMDLSAGFHAGQVAGRYGREESEIQAINAAARKVEKITGYRAYLLLQSANKMEDKESFAVMRKELRKLLTGHAIGLLAKFQKIHGNPKDTAILEDSVDVWMDLYRRGHSGLRLHDAEELQKLLDLLQLLGITNEQVALAGNLPDLFREMPEAASGVPPKNLIQRAGSYRSREWAPLRKIFAPTLLVSVSSKEIKESAHTPYGGASLGMKKLHHLLFLEAVMNEYRKRLGTIKICTH